MVITYSRFCKIATAENYANDCKVGILRQRVKLDLGLTWASGNTTYFQYMYRANRRKLSGVYRLAAFSAAHLVIERSCVSTGVKTDVPAANPLNGGAQTTINGTRRACTCMEVWERVIGERKQLKEEFEKQGDAYAAMRA